MCPKSLVLVLFRVPQELFALVARETELARVFDLHLLPEQDQLGVAPVCVIVLDLANVFVMINPPAWWYNIFWSPVHFSLVLSRLLPVQTQHKSLHEHSLLIIYSFRRIFWSVHLIEFLKAFQFSTVDFHRPALADAGSLCSRGFRVFWCTIVFEQISYLSTL